MEKLSKAFPLPDAMQGRWTDIDDPFTELIVAGGEIRCFGKVVEYDFKTIESKSGATTVSLHVSDPANEDDFQRRNITGLVLTPEGEFHAYNVKFACQFVRPEA